MRLIASESGYVLSDWGLSGKQRMLAVLSVVVLIGSGLWLVLAFRRPLETPKPDPYIGVGQVLAEETGKLLGQSPGRLVLLSRRLNGSKDVRVEAALQAFKDGIRQYPALRITTTEVMDLRHVNDETALAGTGELPAADYLRLLAKYHDATAIVSFIGVPRLTEQEIAQLPTGRPKFIAWSRLSQLRGQLQAGILDLAVINSATRQDRPLTTPRDWFQQYYQVVTPADAAGLPF